MTRSTFVLLAVAWATLAGFVLGQGPRSQNFYIESGVDGALAVQIVQTAETARRDLAIEWYGQELPDWPKPVPIRVLGLTSSGGGATGIGFDGTGPSRISLDGRPEKLIESVIPHEVFHSLQADYFRKPLPRWLDEGLASCVESDRDRQRWRDSLVNEVLKKGRGIPFSRMFVQGADYVEQPGQPFDHKRAYGPDILALYWQGFSAADFLLQSGGKVLMLEYVAQSDHRQALSMYGYDSLATFQDTWLDWVKAGSPPAERVAAYGTTGLGLGIIGPRGGAVGIGFAKQQQPQCRWVPGQGWVGCNQQPSPVYVQPRPQQPQQPVTGIPVTPPAPPLPPDLNAILASINDRLTAIESRGPMPGPPGPMGLPGVPGRPGNDLSPADLNAIADAVIVRLPPQMLDLILPDGTVQSQSKRLGTPLRLQLENVKVQAP